MRPEDELARRIQAYVATQVPAEQVAIVSHAVGMCLATLMNDPQFLNELAVIKDLRGRVEWLHNENIILKGTLAGRSAPRKSPPRKKAAAKRAPIKGNATPSAKRAFRQGYSGT